MYTTSEIKPLKSFPELGSFCYIYQLQSMKYKILKLHGWYLFTPLVQGSHFRTGVTLLHTKCQSMRCKILKLKDDLYYPAPDNFVGTLLGVWTVKVKARTDEFEGLHKHGAWKQRNLRSKAIQKCSFVTKGTALVVSIQVWGWGFLTQNIWQLITWRITARIKNRETIMMTVKY